MTPLQAASQGLLRRGKKVSLSISSQGLLQVRPKTGGGVWINPTRKPRPDYRLPPLLPTAKVVYGQAAHRGESSADATFVAIRNIIAAYAAPGSHRADLHRVASINASLLGATSSLAVIAAVPFELTELELAAIMLIATE